MPLVAAGFLNSFTIRTENWVYSWLTPLWVLGLGALAGLAVIGLLLALAWIGSRVQPLSNLAEHKVGRWVAGLILGGVLFAVCFPMLKGQYEARLQPGVVATTADQIQFYATPLSLFLLSGVALVCMFSRRFIDDLPYTSQEGPIFWSFVVLAAYALYGILGVVLVRDPDNMIHSMSRWGQLGRISKQYTVEPAANANDVNADPPEITLPIRFRRSEIRQMEFSSNESVRVTTSSMLDKGDPPSWDISGGEPLVWKLSLDPGSPLAQTEEYEQLYARNLGDQPAELTVTLHTAPAIPEMLTVPVIGIAILLYFFALVLVFNLAPKLTSIALATAKSEMNTPFYMILVTVGSFLLFVFLWLPYNTFGEDIKMFKFTTLEVVRLLGLLQAVWSASNSVAEEVEGKTALTVLSKPVGRRDFILGKLLGISWAVMVMLLVYGAFTLVYMAYKPVYDTREGGKAPERPSVADPLGLYSVEREQGLGSEEANWHICMAETVSNIPALVMVYCEIVVLAAVSVAISTQLGLVANFIICFAIFTLGHLTFVLCQSSYVAENFEAVIFFSQLIATVIPGLDYFDTSAAIAKGHAIQITYVGATIFYTFLYSTIAMLLALVMFEDRDLA